MCGGGTPSAWHTNRAVPALGRVWLSGLSTMDGGTEEELKEKNDENTANCLEFFNPRNKKLTFSSILKTWSHFKKAFLVLKHEEYKQRAGDVLLETIQYSYLSVYCTLNCEVGSSNSVVAGSRCGSPAEVDSTVLGTDISNNQVSIAQHFGIVHINGFTISTAPGDDGPGISCGNTLQHCSLVNRNCDILRSSNDFGPLPWSGACTFTREGTL